MEQKPFRFPPNLAVSEQLPFTISVIEKQRKEARVLRLDTLKAQTGKSQAEKEALKWKQKYYQEKEEKGKLKKENNQLKKQIERLTKTQNRYQVSLFDHGNFKHQDQNGEKKPKGGQTGHIDTNRENQAGFDLNRFEKKRIFTRECGKCHNLLKRVSSVKQKLLLDIVITPEVVKLIIESERQWCKVCKKEVNCQDRHSLPFTEYGLNTFMMIMVLRHKCHCSMASIAQVITIGYGLKLSKSDVSNLLKTATNYLGKKYANLKQAVRKGEVMYLDETGWRIGKNGAWIWIMATEDQLDLEGNVTTPGITVYVAAESRGKGIAEDIYGSSNAYSMTDGLKSYENTIPKGKHLFCWAHILRFAYEETIQAKKRSTSIKLRDALVEIYHIKKQNPQLTKPDLKTILEQRIDTWLALKSKEKSFNNIQYRLNSQRDGLIRALLETNSGTNNLAERELRPCVLSRKISNGSDTYQGMEATAINASIIQTISRNKKANILTELERSLKADIKQKYWQYQHVPHNSSGP